MQALLTFLRLCVIACFASGCGETHQAGGGGADDSELIIDDRPRRGDSGFRETCGLSACEAGKVCCFASGECVSENAECEPSPAPDDYWPSATEEPSCVSNLDCADDEFCYAPICLGAGICRALDGDEAPQCRQPLDLLTGLGSLSKAETTYLRRLAMVCACDGQNWSSECDAHAAGVRVNSAAEQQPCAGSVGEVPARFENFGLVGGDGVQAPPCTSEGACPDGGACCEVTRTCMEPDSEQCFVPPGPGYPCHDNEQCARALRFCLRPGCAGQGYCADAREYGGNRCNLQDPVCGCDGLTYINRCGAAEDMQTIASLGECP